MRPVRDVQISQHEDENHRRQRRGRGRVEGCLMTTRRTRGRFRTSASSDGIGEDVSLFVGAIGSDSRGRFEKGRGERASERVVEAIEGQFPLSVRCRPHLSPLRQRQRLSILAPPLKSGRIEPRSPRIRLGPEPRFLISHSQPAPTTTVSRPAVPRHCSDMCVCSDQSHAHFDGLRAGTGHHVRHVSESLTPSPLSLKRG